MGMCVAETLKPIFFFATVHSNLNSQNLSRVAIFQKLLRSQVQSSQNRSLLRGTLRGTQYCNIVRFTVPLPLRFTVVLSLRFTVALSLRFTVALPSRFTVALPSRFTVALPSRFTVALPLIFPCVIMIIFCSNRGSPFLISPVASLGLPRSP